MRIYQIILLVFITLFVSFSSNIQAQNSNQNASMIMALISVSNTVIKDTTSNENTSTSLILQSTLTCPKCSNTQIEKMDTTSCKYFYSCGKCKEMIKSEKGQCCVFCSFANVPCPPKQQYRSKGGE